jgi:uncharacterized protein YbjQ (UPF0145 family)
MGVVRILATVAVAAVAVSCASSNQDDPAARWAKEVEVLRPEQLGDRLYDVLAEVEERADIFTNDVEAAKSDAVRKLRYQAAKVDADAVVVISCTPARDWEARANPAIVCRGAALRWINP